MTLVRYHNILIGSIHYHFILSRKLTIAIVQNNEGGQSFWFKLTSSENLYQNVLSIILLVI